MGLIYSVFVPHPPLFVEEIGRGEERKCRASLEAYGEISRRLVQAKVETVILVSPHAPLAKTGITLVSGDTLEGDFSQFGAPQVSFALPADREIIKLFKEGLSGVIPIQAPLDHGAMIPLYFLQKAGWQGKLVLLGMPLEQPERYGKEIGRILESLPGRLALIASGDLSHRLKEEGPYGFHGAGPEFDEFIVRTLSGDTGKIADLPYELIEKAGECGYRSLRLALAAKEGAPEVLSYEGPFGVGYLVADLYHGSPLPRWARRCLQAYLEKGEADPSQAASPEFAQPGGCFVTLKQGGQLRGCIGTTEAWQENLALEIQHNAIAAGTRDPRFPPVRAAEVAGLSITVDVLGDLEKIAGPEELDPWKYGVVVRRQDRSGLLLPHLEGVNTVAEQISIAKQKAGIHPQDPAELWRFEVKRHYE